jgi:hypothetical protein
MKLSLAQEVVHFSEFDPRLKANVLFCKLFLESHPFLDQTQGIGAVFS